MLNLENNGPQQYDEQAGVDQINHNTAGDLQRSHFRRSTIGTQWQPQSIDGKNDKHANFVNALFVAELMINVLVGVSTAHESETLRRSHSDHDLYHHQLQHPDHDDGGAEFYTAVGPDGKEIILRKYLQDQADNDMRIGFVSQALGHLEHEYNGHAGHAGHAGAVTDPVQHYHQQRELLNKGDRSMRSSFEFPPEQQFYDTYRLEEDHSQRHGKLGLDQKFSNGSMNRSPKHKIRTPIIEETESTVERELMSRDQSRRVRGVESVQDWSSFSGEVLNLSLSDSRYQDVTMSEI